MKPFCVFLAAMFALGAAGLATAGAKKQPAVAVRFYVEGGGEGEGGKFSQPVQLLGSSRATFMQTMPLISEREIKAYYAFPAKDGTRGAYFRLDDHGRNLLAQHTMAHRGEYVLAFFNGRHVVDLRIDRGVTDGILCIPSGLTPTDVSLLEVTFPEIGKEHISPAQKRKMLEKAEKQKAKAAGRAPTPAPARARQSDGSLAPAR